ncbi:MAG: carboxylesterase/lipase family protein [Caulobacteraceae bacterium]|nr:MAG: carboxylesterase/lipase family protein [Caulobacteraceae bacterium]
MTQPIVTTDSGPLRGVAVDGVNSFLGVPYAAAPVGPLRFEKPQRPAPWSEPRDATAPGATYPQTMRPFDALDLAPLIGEGVRPGDDWLNLNVWAPAGAAGLPVMVWIHGGGFVAGSGHTPVNDGTSFARNGVVLISLNYRMGVDGFMAIPDGITNLGLRDQIFALEWVQRNAAAFGGDPANVTVFGESAGAMSVADLVASPLARGLFRRAIIQSGHGSMVRPVEVSHRLARKVARMMRVPATVEGFRSRTAEQTLPFADRVQLPTVQLNLRDDQGREPAFGLSRYLPVYGDDVLPEHPLAALANGAGKDVEILIGTNREEMNVYFVPTGVRKSINRWLAWYMVSRSIRGAKDILRDYGYDDRKVKAGDMLSEAMHDLVFRWPARVYAQAHQGPTHFYEFDWKSPAFGGALGACHALEIPFVFNTLSCATGEKGLAGPNPPQDLADRMHATWADFAKGRGVPWEPYDAVRRQVHRFDKGETVTDPDMPAARHWRP